MQDNVLIQRHEIMFTKLLTAMFADLLSIITSQNCDKKGNPLDADLKCKFDRYFILVFLNSIYICSYLKILLALLLYFMLSL